MVRDSIITVLWCSSCSVIVLQYGEMPYLLQHFRAEPGQHLDAVLREVVDNLGPLTVTDQTEDTPQTGHAHLSVCRDQYMAGLHTPARGQTQSVKMMNTPKTCVYK